LLAGKEAARGDRKPHTPSPEGAWTYSGRASERGGGDPQHISRIEGALNVPSLELVVRLSAALGVTTDFLLTGKDRPALDVKGAIRSVPDMSPAAKRLLVGLVGELRRSE
jgi:transcriptional regulator with XRE-family HTH domain